MKETIRWAILGAGHIATKFATGLKAVPQVELYAVASRSYDSAEAFAKHYGFKKAYESYEEMVLDPLVDIVYIATPHVFHCTQTLLCLNHGKAVLCEKAFAMNEREVRLMVDTAKHKQLFLMEAMWSRFLKHIQKIKQLIDDGAIGEVVHLRSDLGFRAPVKLDGRLYNPELGGGSLLDVGIYPIFMATYLLGMPQQIISSSTLTDRGIDSSTSAIFTYPNGALANIFSSFIAETAIETEIAGTKGRIVVDRRWYTPSAFTLYTNDGNEQRFTFDVEVNGYEEEAKEATQCLLNNQLESDLMTHQMSINLMKIMDTIRQQNGIRYKADNTL